MTKILIIDDDRIVRRDVSRALTKVDYDVIEASGPFDGIESAKSQQPDLILLDILMPEMDGITVLRQLRQDPETSEIPVIMVSSLGSESQVTACLEEGAVDHILKPFSHRLLSVHVSAGLRKGSPPAVDDEAPATVQGASPIELAPEPVDQPTVRFANARTTNLKDIVQPSRLHNGRVIAFLGAKGGVGTTTVAANAAAICALNHQSVIVSEMRSTFGTLSTVFNARPRQNLRTLLDHGDQEGFELAESKWNEFLMRDSGGLRILFGPQGEDGDIGLEPADALHVVNGMIPLADLILLDLPPGLSDVNLELLKISDLVILVLDCEPTSVTAAKVIMDQLDNWSIRHAIKAVVVKRTQLSIPPKITDIQSSLGCDFIGIVPPGANQLAFAAQSGGVLAAVQPEDDVSLAIERLVENHICSAKTESVLSS